MYISLMPVEQPSIVTKTVVLVTLVFIGIIISTIFVMTMAFNMKALTVMLCFYVVAYSTYTFFCQWIFRDKLKNDFRYQIGLYTTIFTMFLSLSLVVLAFIIKPQSVIPSSSSTPTSLWRYT